ncbi:hypothetical protein SAMN05421676_109139 [Salinibacillus kushneri]|uniref:Uncharacterized protein n=1 Tax=Salinibacillus kushneri TaxID=237682 RepID=A0A1I0HTD3_9BACI|nr:hypothetical protein [Salinibacillus kushneri]SET86500.1 hypothetical protein SAMN05421676_109139 [Salinibacillus kushneri]
MKSLQDVVYNWLTIQLVADARPEDQAAIDTAQFFKKMLENDHNVEKIEVKKLEDMYSVMVEKKDENRSFRFPIELIECINDQIQKEPEKFTIYP